jgi:alginate O-acetyltransferase complex protein AlgI
VAVGANLLVLGVFKYANFFVENVNALLGPGTLPLAEILLPIGISFYSFHAISYVVDVYRRDAIAQKSPVHAALYLLLFPQLIAGPIVRYRDLADQLKERVVTADDFAYGIRRFVTGLGKKLLIANTVAVAADAIFKLPPAQWNAPLAWLALVCYTLQIYFDFSGYSDMAIGLGRLFGFRFPENFKHPYVADSVQDFWRRWHISLSSWFRDYLYVPLGGSRRAPSRTYLNLVIVFFLCGLWHGASWNFVIWGLFHGAFLVLERLGLSALLSRFPAPVRHAYLLLVVMIGWVFFRAETLPQALAFLMALVGFGGAEPSPYAPAWFLHSELWLALVAGAVGSLPIGTWLLRARARLAGPPALLSAADVAATGVLVFVFLVSVLQVASRSYNPFIYFRF